MGNPFFSTPVSGLSLAICKMGPFHEINQTYVWAGTQLTWHPSNTWHTSNTRHAWYCSWGTWHQPSQGSYSPSTWKDEEHAALPLKHPPPGKPRVEVGAASWLGIIRAPLTHWCGMGDDEPGTNDPSSGQLKRAEMFTVALENGAGASDLTPAFSAPEAKSVRLL